MRKSIRVAILAACAVGSLEARAASRLLSFPEAVEEILHRSTGVASQRAGLDAARARAVPVRLRFAPDLQLSARASREEFGGIAATGRKLEATSSLNLFRFGGDLAAVRAVDR